MRFFTQRFSPQNNKKLLFWFWWLDTVIASSRSQTTASKKLIRRREIFFLKMSRNPPKTSKRQSQFSKNFQMQTYLFVVLIWTISRKTFLQYFTCWLTLSGSRVIAEKDNISASAVPKGLLKHWSCFAQLCFWARQLKSSQHNSLTFMPSGFTLYDLLRCCFNELSSFFSCKKKCYHF